MVEIQSWVRNRPNLLVSASAQDDRKWEFFMSDFEWTASAESGPDRHIMFLDNVGNWRHCCFLGKGLKWRAKWRMHDIFSWRHSVFCPSIRVTGYILAEPAEATESGLSAKTLCAFWRRPRVIKGHWAGGRRPAPSNWCPFGQFNRGPATKWWLLPTPTV